MNQEIRGEKVILREQREEDAPYFTYWFNQPQVMFQCGFEKPASEEEKNEMRAAFGKGQTVVNILTGERYSL